MKSIMLIVSLVMLGKEIVLPGNLNEKVGSSSSLSCRETVLTKFGKAEEEREVGLNLC